MDILEKLQILPSTQTEEKICEEAFNEIQSLRSQLSSQWISVNDRFPNDYEDVYVVVKNNIVNIEKQFITYLHSNGRWDLNRAFDEVTHWMHLHEFPKD